MVQQYVAAGDREIHDWTEAGYRKANAAALFLPALPVSSRYLLYRVGVAAVASHFSARASLACGKMTMHRWPRARYALRMLTLAGGILLHASPIRPTSIRVTILIDIQRLSLVHDQLPFLFLLIYLFSIKVNGRERGRTFYRIVDTYLSARQDMYVHTERSAVSLSRVASSDIINFSLLDNSSDKSPKQEYLVDKSRHFPDCRRANKNEWH